MDARCLKNCDLRRFILDSWHRIAKKQRADKKEEAAKREHQAGRSACPGGREGRALGLGGATRAS